MNAKVLASLTLPVALAAAWYFWPSASVPPPTAPVAEKVETAETRRVAPVAKSTVELALAIEQKNVLADFVGNGRTRMLARLQNTTAAPLEITVPVGQMFEAGSSSMISIRPAKIEIPPGRKVDMELFAAAVKSSNKLENSSYRFSYATLPRLDNLLVRAQARAELTVGAIQTAILAVTENLPLSSLAKFTMATAALPSRFNTDAFRVETFDLMLALTLLRESGVSEKGLALTIDPQLRIEAMIDPNTRPMAMTYYGIRVDREWDFWREELLNGQPATRHYALYGIARFYPDVALQMLPRWAMETRTNPVYRLAAVQALADTQRPEALPMLRQLHVSLGAQTELGRAAAGAAEYLGYQLEQMSRKSVAFRTETATLATATAR